jgi:hypothetical protein
MEAPLLPVPGVFFLDVEVVERLRLTQDIVTDWPEIAIE